MADESPVKLRKISTNCKLSKGYGLSRARTSGIETLIKAVNIREDLVSEILNPAARQTRRSRTE